MKRSRTSAAGFTIVELTIAMIVIGILASIAVIGYSSIQRQARDTERDGHVAQLNIALQKYHADHSEYPDVCSGGLDTPCPASDLAAALSTYLDTIPHDPSHAEDSADDYQYVRGTNSSSYGLKVTFEVKDECKSGKNVDEDWWTEAVPICE